MRPVPIDLRNETPKRRNVLRLVGFKLGWRSSKRPTAGRLGNPCCTRDDHFHATSKSATYPKAVRLGEVGNVGIIIRMFYEWTGVCVSAKASRTIKMLFLRVLCVGLRLRYTGAQKQHTDVCTSMSKNPSDPCAGYASRIISVWRLWGLQSSPVHLR